MNSNKFIAVAIDKSGNIWKGHFGIAYSFSLFDGKGNLIKEIKNPYAVTESGQKHQSKPGLISDLLPQCNVFIGKKMGKESFALIQNKLGIIPFLTTQNDPLKAVKEYLAKQRN